MLAKNRNIGHWWRFSGFFNMPPEPFPAAFCVIRATPNAGRATPNTGRRTPDAGTQEGQNLPVKAYFFESGATYEADFST